MKRHRTAEEIGTVNIEMAARYGRPSPPCSHIDAPHLLHIAAVRDVPDPEEVDVSRINGREPLPWEEGEIKAARLQARAAEAALLAGTAGQP